MKQTEEFTCLSVGGRYWGQTYGPYPEGIEFNYDAGGYRLTVSLPDLTEKEKRDLESGKMMFGAFVKDGILFFLFRCGKSFSWCECPYNWWLVAEENRAIPEPHQPNERCLLQVFVVDSSINRILSMRAITVPVKVSEVIVEAIRSQISNGMYDYDKKLNRVRMDYVSSEMAIDGWVGIGGE